MEKLKNLAIVLGGMSLPIILIFGFSYLSRHSNYNDDHEYPDNETPYDNIKTDTIHFGDSAYVISTVIDTVYKIGSLRHKYIPPRDTHDPLGLFR